MNNGIIENPNKQVVEEINIALFANDGYCPCKLEHIPENKCICKEFIEQDSGECHCGKYIKLKLEEEE